MNIWDAGEELIVHMGEFGREAIETETTWKTEE
jgi:hypothetical protein